MMLFLSLDLWFNNQEYTTQIPVRGSPSALHSVLSVNVNHTLGTGVRQRGCGRAGEEQIEKYRKSPGLSSLERRGLGNSS